MRSSVCAWVAVMATPMLLVAASSAAQSPDADLERQHLRLDIQRLQRESGWQADIQHWLPAASALVAFAAVMYGAWRYFDERGRELEVSTVEGVAHNLERLADRRPDGSNLNARAIVALRNLNALAPVPSRWPVSDHRAAITEALAGLVRYDLKTFRTADDARFPVLCVQHWPELERLVSVDAELCFLMLERYVGALKLLATPAAAYVRNTTREDGGGYPRGAISLDDWQLFAAIVEGFELFAAAAPQGERRRAEIRDFTATAPALGQQLFPTAP
jgi:hypothetical protein